jgi:hypothetical protein
MLTDRLLEEIEEGQGETLVRAARRIPRTRQDRPVTLSCLLRWITTGVIAYDGQRVRLEAARLAGKWITTPGAILRFIRAQTPNAEEVPRTATPSRRLRAAERAGRHLEKLGV